LFLILAVLAIPVANVVVDPFYRFDLVRIDGFNVQKPQFAAQARLAKAGVVCRLQPASVVMGTSRVEVGIDPSHPGWGRTPGPTYNLALAGSGLKELSLTFQHVVHASSRLRLVVMGIDFLMFNAHREAVVFGTEVFGFDEQRLLLSPTDSCWRSFLYDINQLVGPKGIAFAWQTIASQMPETERNDISKAQVLQWLALYDRKGFRGNSFDVMNNLILRDGHHSIFNGASGRDPAQEFYYTTRVWRPQPEERYCFTRDGRPDTLSLFREIAEFARKSGVEVRFFINPIHARMLIALQEAGLWPQYEDWKRELVNVLAQESERSHAQPFPLWDFSGVNTVTTEPIPAAKVKTEMLWWWEPSHYRRQAGDLILDRVLDHSEPSRTVPNDFGISLSHVNIEDWIAKTREAVRDYARREPGEVEILRERLLPVMEDAEGSNCGYDVQAAVAGSEALRRGDHEAAEAAFARASAIHEADRRRFEKLGVPFREKAFPKILAEARLGREIGPKLSWQDYQARGNDRLAKGLLKDAGEDYSQAIRLGPPNTALFFLRGTTRLRLEQFKEAMVDFEAGLKLDPKNATLQQLLEQARTGAPQ
jgi:tetratricopeptide (TPR) repeat protein